jgi:spoIIIJ-associated protein
VEWVEITARTVREATDQALDQLGVDESDAEIDVVEEPRPGLFGRTRGQARVRARVVPRPHPPKQERRDRKRGSRNGGGRGRGGDGGSRGGTTTTTDAGGDAARPAERAEEGSPGGRRRRRGGGGGGGGGRQDRPRPEADSTARAPETEAADRPRQGDNVDTDILPLDEHVACVRDFLAGLVEAFAVDATIDVVEVDDETREVQVNGADLGLLIGPRGLTLQAVGELARTVVYRKAPDGQEGRVRIDIGGYRERRREALVSFATKIAEDVRESGRAKALEPMSPPDRKVVHDTINEIDGVQTTSEGAEPRRRVVVLPD